MFRHERWAEVQPLPGAVGGHRHDLAGVVHRHEQSGQPVTAEADVRRALPARRDAFDQAAGRIEDVQNSDSFSAWPGPTMSYAHILFVHVSAT
jgi:hypothetical protein